MTEQVEIIYDWMIKNGKKLGKKRIAMRDDIVYNSSRIAQIHESLLKKRGLITKFCNHLVTQRVFTNLRSAQQAVRLYATNTGTCTTYKKRTKIVELYDKWEDGKVITKNMAKYNQKLNEHWKTRRSDDKGTSTITSSTNPIKKL